MYDKMRRSLYFLHMENDVYDTIYRCESFRKHRGHPKHQLHLQLFQPQVPLECIAIEILGLLPKTKRGSQFIFVITDRYRILTRAITRSNITAPVVAKVFPNACIILYGIPSSLLSENGPQFFNKFFAAFCAFLGTKLTMTTASHPQTNGQTEQ